jgi:hypothetical protein
MSVPRQRADTVYAPEIYPWWNSLNDRVAYQRAFDQGTPEIKREAQAMISQDPLTPREEIRANMTTRKLPPRFGYSTEEITIDEVLNNDFELAATHVNDTAWNEFSDTNGEINSTDRPATGNWW